MGIPSLKRHLEPYAAREALESGDVVVDGPALAYHILNLCLRAVQKQSRSPLDQPSYELLGTTAIAWLERVQIYGLSVSAIYFDSYLPSNKRPERIQRLIKLSRDLVKFHSAFSAGVPRPRNGDRNKPGHATDAITSQAADLFPTSSWPTGTNNTQAAGGHGRTTHPAPPPPPFLVPAIIDALRASSTFGPLVRTVPGEADGFCARHVCKHGGGIIFTSDTDLLVHDLGGGGSVVFFGDIELDGDATSSRLVARVYRPEEICRRLGMTMGMQPRGFSRLAFEVSRDSFLTAKQAAAKVRKGESEEDDKEEKEYAKFMEQYLSPEVAPELAEKMSGTLDPRVSEIVLAVLPGIESNSDTALEGEDAAEVTMFLPFLLDCPTRTSAWQASTPIRQLAYRMLRSIPGARREMSAVFEMRRLQTASSGLRVEMTRTQDAEDFAELLLTVLSEFEERLDKRDRVWVMLAIYLDILMTSQRGRGRPISLDVLSQLTKGTLDSGSWDFLHLLAEVQATHYSLRMLCQVMGFVARHPGTTGPPRVSQLTAWLSRLPPLSEYPTPMTLLEMLGGLREPASLGCLESLFAEDEDMIRLIKAVGKPNKRTQGEPKKKKLKMSPGDGNHPASQPSVKTPTNAFELLAGCEEGG
ncbi:hypothetical protein VTJ83DRAFT_4831 [Remersonia thermophila]|uniref:Asteroid domain-containing protein n=1 Tax=Remersonia thermophila TaxID=72144 RepID=A0ABR4DD39_9PEZI